MNISSHQFYPVERREGGRMEGGREDGGREDDEEESRRRRGSNKLHTYKEGNSGGKTIKTS